MVPENEIGVIVIFSKLEESAGFKIISIDGKFPDALLEKDGKTYRAEFEYQALNFRDHKHDVRDCDLIIAWENDWPDCILPVLALSEPDWMNTDLTLPSKDAREAAYWKQRALLAERRLTAYRENFSKSADHENMGPFDCPGCDRMFATIQARNAHQRFCTGESDENGSEPMIEQEGENHEEA